MAPHNWAPGSWGKSAPGWLAITDWKVRAAASELVGANLPAGRARSAADGLQGILEQLQVDAQNKVAILGDKAAVAVKGEAGITDLAAQALGGVVIQTQIQDRIHHARHGRRRA